MKHRRGYRPHAGLNPDPECPACWNLDDVPSLSALVSGVDVIVHCAGAVRGRSEDDFNRVNVDGLARLVEVGRSQTATPRFLSMSSLAAREPQLSYYSARKRQGELALGQGAGSMPWAALRPPAVYGPGDRELLPLFRLMSRGLAPVLGGRTARFSLIFIDDLVAAISTWINQDRPAQGVFELHDGHDGGYSWQDVVDIAASRRGGRVLKLPVPRPLLQSIALMSMGMGRLSGRAPMLTLGKVRELTHINWVCDNSAISAATGWTPRVLFAEGLARTLDADSLRRPGSSGAW